MAKAKNIVLIVDRHWIGAMMINKIEKAKSTLWHYFELIARKSGTNLYSDCRTEIEGIIDDIVDSINAVPVVRCGNCKYLAYDKDGTVYWCRVAQGLDGDRKMADFCSYFEEITK